MKPETRFRQTKVIPFLKALENCEFFAIQQTTKCGDPDYLLCISGRFVGMELKTDTGRATRLQMHKLQCIADAGGVALLVRPNNWADAKKVLKQISKGEYDD